MKITILTLFPEMFAGVLKHSIIKRARQKKILEIELVNIRNFATDRHKTVDDRPYGGGVGMVMKVDILDRAIESLKLKVKERIILLDPQGKVFNQKMAQKITKFNHLILVCGHYEGVDARTEKLVDEVVSIGDYILTGGEIPAMVVVDTVTRLLPGVLEKTEATKKESFATSLLEYPQYTRPEIYKGWRVPAVLLSGNHQKIEKWRKKQAWEKTRRRRPDLLKA